MRSIQLISVNLIHVCVRMRETERERAVAESQWHNYGPI